MIEERNHKILGYLLSAARAGRKIILLSERVEHVRNLRILFDEVTKGEGFETRMYIGGVDAQARAEAEENADIFFATTQMAKEALDIPSLDTLFLITPQGSPITTEQAVGRIARAYEGKKSPLVVDFVDNLNYTKALWYKRAKVYRDMGLQIGDKEKGSSAK
jgi:superfamily II DNA or RNA helicase